METVPNINTLQFKFLQYSLLWNILGGTECQLLPDECLTFMGPCLCLQFVVLGAVLQSCSVCHCPLCLLSSGITAQLIFVQHYAFPHCAIFFHVEITTFAHKQYILEWCLQLIHSHSASLHLFCWNQSEVYGQAEWELCCWLIWVQSHPLKQIMSQGMYKWPRTAIWLHKYEHSISIYLLLISRKGIFQNSCIVTMGIIFFLYLCNPAFGNYVKLKGKKYSFDSHISASCASPTVTSL